MFASGSLLAQSRPAGTTAVTAFAASMRTEITRIVVCNTTGSAAAFSIYHDDDGTTFDETTALYFGQTLAANTSVVVEAAAVGGGVTVADGGAIGIKTGTGSALTFSISGVTQMTPTRRV